jgi:hypothetical protein
MSNELTSLFTRIGIFAVLIAIFFWMYQDPQRDDTGTIVQGGNIDPLELFAGDCYLEKFEVLEEGDFMDQSTVDAVPCTSKHNNEIFAAFASLVSIESGQDVFTQMTEQCYGEVLDYVGFSDSLSEEDIIKFDSDYRLLVTFNFDDRLENKEEPDPRKPFSCIMNSRENFTDFSIKDYFAL